MSIERILGLGFGFWVLSRDTYLGDTHRGGRNNLRRRLYESVNLNKINESNQIYKREREKE